VSGPNAEVAQPSILLVDDRAENLLALEAILKPLDYRLLSARSGEEALHIALREKLTVILLDVVMPKMDGFEVAQFLKQTERTRSIPILFLTAVATDAQQIYRAYDVGAVDYLIKPLDPAVVRKKVTLFVELVQQREEIARQAECLCESQHREYELRLHALHAASLQRYRKLVEGIDHTIAWSGDETPRLTFISARAESMLGFPTIDFIAPDFWGQHIHPDDREDMLAMFDKVIREGVDITANHRVVAADGHILWFRTAMSREVSDDGRPEIHGISIDVTDIMRAEATQALLADLGTILSELDYRTSLQKLAVRLVPDIADWCLIDEVASPGKLVEVVAAHADGAEEAWLRRLGRREPDERSAVGVARVASSGKSELFSDITDERWLAEALGAHQIEPLQTLGARSCMFVPLSACGRTLGVLSLISAGSRRIFGPSDLVVAEEVGRRAGMAMEHARLYREAERAWRAREDLLAIVSHDLRNPLTSILASVGILDKVAGDERVTKYARVILRSAERMEHLIRDLLDFAEIEAGALVVKRQIIESASLIRDTVEILKPLAEKKKLRLETQVEGELSVSCDRDRILQVLSNLVGNAIKFTPDGGSISIRVTRSGANAEFAVSDTGPGIPETELAHIWERFWQGKERLPGSVGLGLAIAKGLVEAHGGRIWTESRVGVGTTMYFTLSLASAATPAAQADAHHVV
jgi:PAS domain S-box-containing protein